MSLVTKAAVILCDDVVIGKVYGFEYEESATPIEEHTLAGGAPDLIDISDLHYTFSWEAAYLADTYGANLRAGTSFTWRMRPEGTGGSEDEVQLSGAVILRRKVRAGKNTVIMESVSGIAASIGNVAQS